MTGILLFVSCSRAADLATELFTEQQWEGALREAHRVLLHTPTSDAHRLISAVCNVRLGRHRKLATQTLAKLHTDSTHDTIREHAAFEHALLQLENNNPTSAFDSFAVCFLNTRHKDRLGHSAYQLARLAKRHPALQGRHPSLLLQINSARNLWTPTPPNRAAPPPAGGGCTAPGRLVVWFYRTVVGPCLGQRCLLHPSCSAYFLQAAHQHGLLAFPLFAERLYREPGLTDRREHPIQVNGRTRYADPLSDHTFWHHDIQRAKP